MSFMYHSTPKASTVKKRQRDVFSTSSGDESDEDPYHGSPQPPKKKQKSSAPSTTCYRSSRSLFGLSNVKSTSRPRLSSATRNSRSLLSGQKSSGLSNNLSQIMPNGPNDEEAEETLFIPEDNPRLLPRTPRSFNPTIQTYPASIESSKWGVELDTSEISWDYPAKNSDTKNSLSTPLKNHDRWNRASEPARNPVFGSWAPAAKVASEKLMEEKSYHVISDEEPTPVARKKSLFSGFTASRNHFEDSGSSFSVQKKSFSKSSRLTMTSNLKGDFDGDLCIASRPKKSLSKTTLTLSKEWTFDDSDDSENDLVPHDSPKKSFSRPYRPFKPDESNHLDSGGSNSDLPSLRSFFQKSNAKKKSVHSSYDETIDHTNDLFSLSSLSQDTKLSKKLSNDDSGYSSNSVSQKVPKPEDVIVISDLDLEDSETPKYDISSRDDSFKDSDTDALDVESSDGDEPDSGDSDTPLTRPRKKSNGFSKCSNPRAALNAARFNGPLKKKPMRKRIKNSRLKDREYDTEDYETASDSSSSASSDDEESSIPASTPRSKQRRCGKNINDQVLKDPRPTKVTPLIRQLAGVHFGQHLDHAESATSPVRSYDISCDLVEAHARCCAAWEAAESDGEEKRFEGNVLWYDINTGRSGYQRAVIGGQTFHAGDNVIVQRSDSTNHSSGAYDMENLEIDNQYSKSEAGDRTAMTSDLPWFAKIAYFYEDEHLGKCFHARWYYHGVETWSGNGKTPSSQVFAGPHELFMSDICDDNPVACINRKVEVDFIASEQENSYDNGVVETEYTNKKNHFFCRFQFDPSSNKISDLVLEKPALAENTRYCANCVTKMDEKLVYIPKVISKSADGSLRGIEYGKNQYFVDDYIYLEPMEGSLLEVGQIISMEFHKGRPKTKRETDWVDLEIQSFKRATRRNEMWYKSIRQRDKQEVRDERLLVLDHTRDTICKEHIYLEGKCQVRHLSQIPNLDEYKDDLDSFYIKDKLTEYTRTGPKTEPLDPEEVQCSKETEDEIQLRKRKMEHFFSKGQKVKALEIFAGAGFMSAGLRESGAVDPAWASEIAPAAATTFKRNSPETEVFIEDANICLERAMQQDVGERPRSEARDNCGQPVKRMPRRGEVYILVAGFPCPGYSKFNFCPKADDPKNTLILSVLSYIDFYRPPYVLLENVVSLLDHKLGGKQASKNRIAGGVENGTIKFIYRVLTCLGYQVQHTVLQSGAFGVPQSRQRVIIWGARAGFTLPEFPQPETTFKGRGAESWHRNHGNRTAAPHEGVTVADLITDLPAFELANPHNIIKATRHDIEHRLERANSIEQCKVFPDHKFVGRDKEPYPSRPLNEFQRELRKNTKNSQVLNHVIPSWYDEPSRSGLEKKLRQARTEQICNVPLVGGADHRDLPDELKSWGNYHQNSAAKKNDYYPGKLGRLSLDEPLQTCVTTLSPSNKRSRILHPTQHRPYTVREIARAQGISDSFEFDLNERIELIYRMIGNGVPPPLAKAVVRGLFDILVEDCWKTHLLETPPPPPDVKQKPVAGAKKKNEEEKSGRTRDDAIVIPD